MQNKLQLQQQQKEQPDMNDLPEIFGSSNIHNFKLTTTGAFDMKDLPETFGSSNINNFKQTTTTTTTTGGLDNRDLPEAFNSSNINNFKQTTITITTKGILDMKDLHQTFGSSNINNYKQTKTKTTTIKTTGNSPIDLNHFKLEKNDHQYLISKILQKQPKLKLILAILV